MACDRAPVLNSWEWNGCLCHRPDWLASRSTKSWDSFLLPEGKLTMTDLYHTRRFIHSGCILKGKNNGTWSAEARWNNGPVARQHFPPASWIPQASVRNVNYVHGHWWRLGHVQNVVVLGELSLHPWHCEKCQKCLEIKSWSLIVALLW